MRLFKFQYFYIVLINSIWKGGWPSFWTTLISKYTSFYDWGKTSWSSIYGQILLRCKRYTVFTKRQISPFLHIFKNVDFMHRSFRILLTVMEAPGICYQFPISFDTLLCNSTSAEHTNVNYLIITIYIHKINTWTWFSDFSKVWIFLSAGRFCVCVRFPHFLYTWYGNFPIKSADQ